MKATPKRKAPAKRRMAEIHGMPSVMELKGRDIRDIADMLLPESVKNLKPHGNRRPNNRYNVQTIRAILVNIMRGMRPGTAARAVGVERPATLSHWKTQYPDFGEAVECAKALCEGTFIDLVYHHAKDDGHLALKFLERRFPDRWSPKEIAKVEHSGSVEGVIPLQFVAAIQRARARKDGIEQ